MLVNKYEIIVSDNVSYTTIITMVYDKSTFFKFSNLNTIKLTKQLLFIIGKLFNIASSDTLTINKYNIVLIVKHKNSKRKMQFSLSAYSVHIK